jgi:hypothetical protein
VTITLYPEEPGAGPWRMARIADVVASCAVRARLADERPLVVAVDGRSSSGKTILAARHRVAWAELIDAGEDQS